MKTSIIILALLFIRIEASGQNQDISGFGGFVLTSSPIVGNNTVMTGGHGAMIIDSRYYFGGFGVGMGSPLLVKTEQSTYNLEFDQGGFMVGYILQPEKHLSFTLSSTLGWGDLRTTGVDNGEFLSTRDELFLITPSSTVQLTISDWLRFTSSLGYQMSFAKNITSYSKDDFTGATYSLGLVFGWFKKM